MDENRLVARTALGQFAPGISGNPRGRPRGSLNRRTLIERALREGEDLGVARVVIDAALGGDVVRAQFLVGRLEPQRRGARIAFDLPDDPTDLQDTFTRVLQLLAAGEISGEEALPIGRFLQSRSGIELYFPPQAMEEAETEEAPGRPSPEWNYRNVREDTASSPPAGICRGAACAAREATGDDDGTTGRAGPAPTDTIAAAAAVEAAAADAEPDENPSPACGGGQGGGTPTTQIESGASPHPDLPPLSRKQACADATGEAELRREQAGEGDEVASAEAEFLRRDRLWRAGELAGPALFEHVAEKRRRGQFVNGLLRGFAAAPVGAL